jgi:phage minor structural protein GP20
MNKDELIKLGLTEEQATKLMEKYGNMIPQSRFNEVVEEKNKLKADLTERDKQLSELQKNNSSNEELKKQITELQEKNKASEKEYQKTLAKVKLDNALELALTSAGARNNLAVKALLKMENIKMDNDKVIGLTEQIEELKKTSDYLFKVEDKTPPAPVGTTPANPNGGSTETKVTLGSALGAIYKDNKF